MKSLIWEHFHKVNNVVKCKICKTVIATKGNTTNLHSYLRNRHPLTYTSLENKKRRLSVSTNSEEEESFSSSAVSSEEVIQQVEDSQEASNSNDLLDSQFPSTSNDIPETMSSEATLSKLNQATMESFTMTAKRSTIIDRAVAYFVAVDMQPYSIVESDSFKHLFSVIRPSYLPYPENLCLTLKYPNCTWKL